MSLIWEVLNNNFYKILNSTLIKLEKQNYTHFKKLNYNPWYHLQFLEICIIKNEESHILQQNKSKNFESLNF